MPTAPTGRKILRPRRADGITPLSECIRTLRKRCRKIPRATFGRKSKANKVYRATPGNQAQPAGALNVSNPFICSRPMEPSPDTTYVAGRANRTCQRRKRRGFGRMSGSFIQTGTANRIQSVWLRGWVKTEPKLNPHAPICLTGRTFIKPERGNLVSTAHTPRLRRRKTYSPPLQGVEC